MLILLSHRRAGPVASGISHGNSVVLTGSGFGTKSTPAPILRDIGEAAAGTLDSQWAGAWPSAGTADYRTKNRDVGFSPTGASIGAPHSYVSRILAGAHGESVAYNQGYNVLAYVNYTLPTLPYYSYWSWYHRNDPNWAFGIGENGDDNYKFFDFAADDSPFTRDWFIEHNPRFSSNSDTTAEYHLFDNSTSLENPDQNSNDHWWDAVTKNPWNSSNGWVKLEVELKITDQNSGYIKLWEDNVLKVNYLGITSNHPSETLRAEAIGGFARAQGSANNYRYFADVYYDRSLGRVLAANNATYASATIVEPQVATAWSDTSVTVNFNRGKLSSGTVYFFVKNPSTGTMVSAGSRTIA